MNSRTKMWGILMAAAMLALSVLACTISTSGGGGQEPFVGGDCEGNSTRLNMNSSASGRIAGGTTFEQVYQMFCLWVPDNGSRLVIEISGFGTDVDLDLYVDRSYNNLLSESGFGEWYSNDVGTTSEQVTINNPGGRYYIQVVSYDGSPSSFTISNTFTP
ncbi:MAG: PPC domain-containing protein [Anaerolineales bacterium]